MNNNLSDKKKKKISYRCIVHRHAQICELIIYRDIFENKNILLSDNLLYTLRDKTKKKNGLKKLARYVFRLEDFFFFTIRKLII